ncbi:Ankyrin repeat, SAM and basic leucine zipper domain-containing protein 1 [Neonectria punicea]|uniref:Ankyrin repeat, SAM and basic leucine zipper domain-containing protein 1 n=1 Tax=Neonectria punicea TaxID=979145 RepID=A0ABR1HC48_9HYPO
MLESGLALKYEDRLGCTALLHAWDSGATEAVKLLIEAGVNVTRWTRYGITPLDLVESNVKAGHTRPMQRA